MITRVVVDRSKWLRGEGSYKSRLLRPADGRMCCMGSAALAKGLSKDEIRDVQSVEKWPGLFPNHYARLYTLNDSIFDFGHREEDIQAAGQEVGLDFVFVDQEEGEKIDE